MRPGRPKRLPRDRYRGELTVAFHLAVDARRQLFTEDWIVEKQVELLTRATEEFGCVVPVYCFMPDHAHIMLMGSSEESDLLAAMTKFKTQSGTWLFNRQLPKWQSDFWDHVMRASEDWRNHALYIAKNPVRAGLVENWADYPYTGAIGRDLQDMICGFA